MSSPKLQAVYDRLYPAKTVATELNPENIYIPPPEQNAYRLIVAAYVVAALIVTAIIMVARHAW